MTQIPQMGADPPARCRGTLRGSDAKPEPLPVRSLTAGRGPQRQHGAPSRGAAAAPLRARPGRPWMTSGAAGSRLRRAHAGGVGTHLCNRLDHRQGPGAQGSKAKGGGAASASSVDRFQAEAGR